MKTTIKNMKNFFILFAVIALIGCDEVDELTEVDFSTILTEDVMVTLTDDATSISQSLTLNLADNDDIEPYLSKIESINITSASYVLKNYVGVEEATGTLTASAASQTFGPFQHTFFADAQSGTVFTLDPSQLNALANSLTSNNQLTVQFSGTQNPAQNGSFVIEISLDLDVTAQAL
jgi:hypothetical protein